MKWLLLCAVALALSGCGSHAPPRPCLPPVRGGPADVDCEWETCHDGDPNCICYDSPAGPRCQKITSCPPEAPAVVPVSDDAPPRRCVLMVCGGEVWKCAAGGCYVPAGCQCLRWRPDDIRPGVVDVPVPPGARVSR